MSKIVLGKGLQALIPGESTEETKERRFRSVPLDRISPNPLQPRRTFDQAALAELAESFRRNGVMQIGRASCRESV